MNKIDRKMKENNTKSLLNNKGNNRTKKKIDKKKPSK